MQSRLLRLENGGKGFLRRKAHEASTEQKSLTASVQLSRRWFAAKF